MWWLVEVLLPLRMCSWHRQSAPFPEPSSLCTRNWWKKGSWSRPWKSTSPTTSVKHTARNARVRPLGHPLGVESPRAESMFHLCFCPTPDLAHCGSQCWLDLNWFEFTPLWTNGSSSRPWHGRGRFSNPVARFPGAFFLVEAESRTWGHGDVFMRSWLNECWGDSTWCSHTQSFREDPSRGAATGGVGRKAGGHLPSPIQLLFFP